MTALDQRASTPEATPPWRGGALALLAATWLAALGCGGGGGGGGPGGPAFSQGVLRGEYATLTVGSQRGCPERGVPRGSGAPGLPFTRFGTLDFDGQRFVELEATENGSCPVGLTPILEEGPYNVHPTGFVNLPPRYRGKIPSLAGTGLALVSNQGVSVLQEFGVAMTTATTGFDAGSLEGHLGVATLRAVDPEAPTTDAGLVEAWVGTLSHDGTGVVTAAVSFRRRDGEPDCEEDCAEVTGTYEVDPDGSVRYQLGDLGILEGRLSAGGGMLLAHRSEEAGDTQALVGVPRTPDETSPSGLAGAFDVAGYLRVTGPGSEEQVQLAALLEPQGDGTYQVTGASGSSAAGVTPGQRGAGTSQVTTGGQLTLGDPLGARGWVRSDGGAWVGISSQPDTFGLLLGLLR